MTKTVNPPSTLDAISRQAEVFSQSRALLAQRVTALQDGITALRRDHLPGIKRALARAAEVEAQLKALVEANPGAFEKPRTQVFSGVKVGFMKGKGALEMADADAVVARIKRLMPEQADVLIKTVERPVKDALAQLSAADLKRLGVTVTDASDQVVIKPVDSEVDKMVDALLKEAGRQGDGE